MASIYKQGKSPYWYIRLTPKECEILNKRTFSTKRKLKKDALLILDDIKNKIKKLHDNRSLTPKADLTLSQLFIRFKLDHKNTTGTGYNPQTLEAYRKAMNYFYDAVGDKYIKHYSRDDYHKYITRLDAEGLSQNTKAIYSTRIFAIFNWLRKENYIAYNPMKRVAEEKKEIKIRTDAEMKKLLDYSKGKKFESIIKFMMLSAFRASEATALNWEDVKRDSITIKGKGGKIASIPITAQMRKFLKTLKNEKSGSVFKTRYDALRYFFYRAEKKIGIRFHSHDFRKYCLSKLANSGVNIYFVQNYARHSDIKTTLKYYAKADLKKIADEIDLKTIFKF